VRAKKIAGSIAATQLKWGKAIPNRKLRGSTFL